MDLPIAIAVDLLRERCDPFGSCVWDLDEPITIGEVAVAINQKDLFPPSVGGPYEPSPRWTRARHVARVAWFVCRGWSDPISIDFGVPSLNCHVDWPVTDGNHRLAAAIYLGHDHITAECSGSEAEIHRYCAAPPQKRVSR